MTRSTTPNAALAIASTLTRRPQGARLVAALSELATGVGRMVLVSGPSGSGKSRLLAEVVGIARARGLQLLHVEGAHVGHPLHPLQSLIAQLGELEPSGAGDDLQAWQRAPLGQGDLASSPTERRRHFDRIAAALVRTAERRPLVVVLSDLDSADAALVELWSHLGDSLFSTPQPPALLLVGSARRAPAQHTSALCEELPLERLDRDAIRDLLSAPEIVDFFAETSQGQLSALVAMLHQLPSDLPSLFAARLERLGEAARFVLELLALGRRALAMEDLLLAFRLSLRPVEALRGALHELEAAGLVDGQTVEGMRRVQLCERAERDAVARALTPETLRQHHLLLAEVARRHAATSVEDSIAEAEHLIAAAAGERAIGAAMRAAEQLRLGAAPHRAIELYRRASELTSSEVERAEIDRRLHALEVDTGDYQAALESAERLRRRAPTAAHHLLVARTHLLRDEHGLALAALERGLTAQPAGSEGSEAAEIIALAAEAHYLAGDRARATSVATTALQQELPAPQRIELQNTLGKIHLAAGNLDGAAALFASNVAAAQQATLPREECRARFNLGIVELQRGDRLAAERDYRDALELAERGGDVRNRAFILQNLAVLRHWSSDFTDAITHFRAAIAAFRQLGQRGRLAWLAHDLSSVYLDVGDASEAETLVDLGERYATAAPSPSLDIDRLILRGRLAFLAGDRASAAERLEAAESAAIASTDRARARRAQLLAASVALARAEEGEVAALSLVTDKLRAARQGDLPPREQAMVDYLEGRRRLCDEDVPGAIEVLEQSVRTAEALPDLDLAWRALAALAEAHHQDRPSWAPKLKRRRCSPHVRRLLERADAIWHRVAGPLSDAQRSLYQASIERRRLSSFLATGESPVPVEPTITTPPPTQEIATPLPSRPTVLAPTRPFRLVGEHPRLLDALALIDRVAPFDSPVLIRGESGTGKELVADEIWARSPRASKPIIKVNCGALVESLLLSELFGHEKGAFTGAHQRKKGCFETAHGGTLFLDEIGDISQKTQVALLRVLQEREFLRVGGNDPVRVDVRLVFATHRNLEEMVGKGLFREDLYYRLRGIQIELPALRERASDLPLLVRALLDKIARERGEEPRSLDAEAEAMFRAHRWPGNIRELDNTLRSVSLFAEGKVITAADLLRYTDLQRTPRPTVAETQAPMASFSRLQEEKLSLRELKTQIEIECIAKALAETRGNITRAAEKLGMKRPRLSQLIKQYGLATGAALVAIDGDAPVSTTSNVATKEQA